MSTSKTVALVIVASFLGTCLTTAFADPPAHAPANGWRKKHDPNYTGYAGTQWETDYEISTGHCNREAMPRLSAASLAARSHTESAKSIQSSPRSSARQSGR